MKKYLLLLIVPLLMLASCTEDLSAYLAQDKENVEVDGTKPDEDTPYVPGDNELLPGIYLVKLKVMENGLEVERRFKFFMPVSINSAKPISLIFDFHGNINFTGAVPNPIEDVTLTHPLNTLASRENCIVVFPVGSVDATNTTIGWQEDGYTKDLPFFDAMVDWFKTKTPTISPANIYVTGQSSGAIFSFSLAMNRSTVVAAAAPRSGQMRTVPNIPERAVPIISFIGLNDAPFANAHINMANIANKVGGYFENDLQFNEKDTLEIPRYKKYLLRTWSGAKADYQLYSLIDQGHDVSIYYLTDIIWKFFKSHPLNSASTNLFLSVNVLDFSSNVGTRATIDIQTTAGAEITHNAPSDWSPELVGNQLKLTAPKNFFTCRNRSGVITITTTLNGVSKTRNVTYKLTPPKAYFEVGDVYYDANCEPQGVVFWVDPDDISKAKIVCLHEASSAGKEGSSMKFGNFSNDFFTPSKDDGLANTTTLYQKFLLVDNSLKVEPIYSYVWCRDLDGASGWYMPADNEISAIGSNINLVNAQLKSVGGYEINRVSAEIAQYLTSTTVLGSKGSKVFSAYDFATGTIIPIMPKKGSIETAYFRVRAVKQVSK